MRQRRAVGSGAGQWGMDVRVDAGKSGLPLGTGESVAGALAAKVVREAAAAVTVEVRPKETPGLLLTGSGPVPEADNKTWAVAESEEEHGSLVLAPASTVGAEEEEAVVVVRQLAEVQATSWLLITASRISRGVTRRAALTVAACRAASTAVGGMWAWRCRAVEKSQAWMPVPAAGGEASLSLSQPGIMGRRGGWLRDGRRVNGGIGPMGRIGHIRRIGPMAVSHAAAGRGILFPPRVFWGGLAGR